MANWCYTEININVDDGDRAAYIASEIDRMAFQVRKDNRAPALMESIVIGANLGDVSDYETLGIIELVKCKDGVVTVTTESKWVPELDMWRAFVEKYCPDAKVLYYATEPDGELFETNDQAFADKYIADVDGDICWDTAAGIVDRIRAELGDESDAFKGFVEDCVRPDGSIDCDEAYEYFQAALEDNDYCGQIAIGKWNVVSEF